MTVTSRAPLPVFLQRGRAQVRTLSLEDAGGHSLGVTGGTYSLYDADGTAVLEGETASVTNGVPSFSVPADFAANYSLPLEPWREQWDLTGIAGQASTTATVEDEVFVCRAAPVKRVGLEDLYRLHSEWRRQLPASKQFQSPAEPIDVAWEELLNRLLGDGILPQRVLNWRAFSTVHKYWAATLVCRAFMADNPNDNRWSKLADTYWKLAENGYEHHTALRLDRNEDGIADNPGQLEAASPQLFLTDIPTLDPRRYP